MLCGIRELSRGFIPKAPFSIAQKLYLSLGRQEGSLEQLLMKQEKKVMPSERKKLLHKQLCLYTHYSVMNYTFIHTFIYTLLLGLAICFINLHTYTHTPILTYAYIGIWWMGQKPKHQDRKNSLIPDEK